MFTRVEEAGHQRLIGEGKIEQRFVVHAVNVACLVPLAIAPGCEQEQRARVVGVILEIPPVERNMPLGNLARVFGSISSRQHPLRRTAISR